jgi:hypothetical protein
MATGSNSMDVGTHLMAAVFWVPFTGIWLYCAFWGLVDIPEVRWVAVAALPFVVWRYRVYRGSCSRRAVRGSPVAARPVAQ